MMAAPKPEDFPLLLEVFREGLRRGLVNRKAIIDWADEIIKNTDEPDYFFIEVSLSSGVNELIEVLNRNTKSVEDVICPRVLLSQIYHRLINNGNELTVEDAANLIATLADFEGLTPFESNNIYNFEDYAYYLPNLTQLQIEVLDFLSTYDAFNLQNYEQWHQINIEVEEILKEKKALSDKMYEEYKTAWQKKDRTQKIKKRLKIGGAILFLIGFIILDLIWIDGQSPNSGNLILYGVPIFIILRWGYRWWRNKK